MNAADFLKLSNNKRKLETLSKLTDVDKTKLLENQEKLILNTQTCLNNETNRKIKISQQSKDKQILHYDNIISFMDWTCKKYTYNSKTQKAIYQWDIFYCDLGHNIGYEKNKRRPVIIIQRMIRYLESKTVIVAPITIGENFSKLYPHEVLIADTYNGIIKGKIDLSHIRTIDRSRLDAVYCDKLLTEKQYKEKYGTLYSDTTVEIKKALKKLFFIDI